jgi:hypothetical protein
MTLLSYLSCLWPKTTWIQAWTLGVIISLLCRQKNILVSIHTLLVTYSQLQNPRRLLVFDGEDGTIGNIRPCRQPHLLLLSSILFPATAALPLSSAAEFRPGGNLGLVFYLIKPKSPLPSNLSVVRWDRASADHIPEIPGSSPRQSARICRS